MKIYLDDDDMNRPTPIGYVRTHTAQETIDLLSNNEVESISLDHDLGDEELCGNGYQVMLWIEREVAMNDYIPPETIEFHTANPIGRLKMQQSLDYINAYLNRRD